ncbi:MAG: triose-phosphate isomerase [Methylophilaceae bacterium]|nr:triose-phosphate isomerase [Methylophilaceae bacterium]
MKRKMVIANRKMHGNIPDNKAFLEGLLDEVAELPDADYVVCMPHPYHFQVQAILTGTRISWGGQTMSRFEFGAHTGSTSPLMLLEFGCKYVIIGHSERRLSGYESDEASGQRFEEAIKVGLIPIFCMGETLKEFEAGMTVDVVIRQLNAVINRVGKEGLAKGIIAYEPVWAIGTGKAATPEHAQCILSFLRGHIELIDEALAKNITILYGGSVNAKNAQKLFSMPDIDGGLIGGASLNTQEFIAICKAANDAS